MVAFLVSVMITGIMCAIIVAVGRRRPPGTPLTWGEAFLAATFLFALMLMLYGIVPNQWLLWADTELGWRSDSFGIPTPFGRFFEEGITFGGRGRVMISALVIRDLIAGGIYAVAFVGQIVAWKKWQTRGRKPAAVGTVKTSAFGRPVVTKA